MLPGWSDAHRLRTWSGRAADAAGTGFIPALTKKVCKFDEARTIVSSGSPSVYLFRNPRGVSR